MNRFFHSAILAAAAVVAFSCGPKTGGMSQPAEAAVQELVTNVSVVSAPMSDVPQDETYPSTVQAYAINNIVPQTGSRIKNINVEIGDFVRKGQVLAEMDRATLQQTRLKLANDSTELARLKSLFEQGGLSKSDYDAVVLAYNVSKTQYENLLENTILRSPLTGVITARNYDRGDMYAMTSPIFVVQQISPVKLLVAVSEKDYTRVKRGDAVGVSADALPGRSFTGKVSRIYPTIDPASHTFTAEVLVTNSDYALRPGMYAKANITFATNHSVVLPDIAVLKQQGSGQRSVFVVNEDGTVSSRVVSIGRHFDSNYEILDGIVEGEKVVIKGHSSLKNGSKVNVID